MVAAVKATLGWRIGDAARVMRGQEPRQEPDEYLNRLLALWPTLSVDTRRLLLDVAEHAQKR